MLYCLFLLDRSTPRQKPRVGSEDLICITVNPHLTKETCMSNFAENWLGGIAKVTKILWSNGTTWILDPHTAS